MLKLVEEKSVNEMIGLKFEGFISKCPFMTDRDRPDFEVRYKLGHSFNESPVRSLRLT